MKVLILGNGISRLLFAKEIAQWKWDLWGCNFVFVEMGKNLDRITGHDEVMRRAQVWKDLHGYTYEITTREEKEVLPKRVHGNSGMCLLAMALHWEYDEIHLCGFDFGGKDIWGPGLENRNILSGLRIKLKHILKVYPEALDIIRMWGFHGPEIDIKKLDALHHKRHIKDPVYQELYDKYTPIADPENV